MTPLQARARYHRVKCQVTPFKVHRHLYVTSLRSLHSYTLLALHYTSKNMRWEGLYKKETSPHPSYHPYATSHSNQTCSTLETATSDKVDRGTNKEARQMGGHGCKCQLLAHLVRHQGVWFAPLHSSVSSRLHYRSRRDPREHTHTIWPPVIQSWRFWKGCGLVWPATSSQGQYQIRAGVDSYRGGSPAYWSIFTSLPAGAFFLNQSCVQ